MSSIAGSAVVVWTARPLRRTIVLATMFLVTTGLVAVGASGVLAAVADRAVGDQFVAGDAPGVRYSAERCAELREYAPSSRTCREAAASHHTEEVVGYRLAAGVVGVVVAAAWFVARRRRPGDALPPALVPAIGATAFVLAAAASGVLALDALVLGPTTAGAGQWLSAAVVASAMALWFAARLLRVVESTVTR